MKKSFASPMGQQMVKKGRKFGMALVPTFFNILLFMVLLSYIERFADILQGWSNDCPFLAFGINFVGDSYMFTVLVTLCALLSIIWYSKSIRLVD